MMSGSILLDGEDEFCFPIHQDDLNPNETKEKMDVQLPPVKESVNADTSTEVNQMIDTETNQERDSQTNPWPNMETNPDADEKLKSDIETNQEADTKSNPQTNTGLNLETGGILNNGNLFICNLCSKELQDPRQLSCYHTFCANCLRGKAMHGCLTCPECRQQTVLPPDSLLPDPDALIVFLMKSLDETYQAACSNCENFVDFMFYCLTCKQPLCQLCRQETHRAKMFSTHDIVKLGKHMQDVHKVCSEHNEEYMMYCTTRNSLLCIKCFRDTDRSLRSSCVDLETAYTEHLQKVEDMIDSIDDLQRVLHDSILLYQALLLDVKKNAEKERAAIDALYNDVIDRLTKKKLDLLRAVDEELESKEKHFEEYLPKLAAFLPTIEKTLQLSSQFTQATDIYEYLHHSISLFDRLNAILNKPCRLQPTQVSTINTDFHHEFADCLDCILNLPRKDLPVINIQFPKERFLTESRPDLGTHKRLQRPHSFSPLSGAGPFFEHCQSFESNHKLLKGRIFRLKKELETLHRDGTYHRTLVQDERVANLRDECDQVTCKLASQIENQESLKPKFDELWHQELERIAQEQDIYQNQSDELYFLKQDSDHVLSIIQSIAPCISAINDISIFLDPRRAGYPTQTPNEPQSTSFYNEKSEERIPILDTKETSNSCTNEELLAVTHPETIHLKSIPVTLKNETTQTQESITQTHDNIPNETQKGNTNTGHKGLSSRRVNSKTHTGCTQIQDNKNIHTPQRSNTDTGHISNSNRGHSSSNTHI
ncbi:RING finger protein 207-like [Anneissia japonica]|uniref:RING finger protein 207-like n=1 Tax=Anneissia japonica TaxID=1529436 RepID=UPI0014255BCE|nr:RING finger protein 207-like [Anneissia japonica]